jgi:DNA-directed RNA polymerase specialized sigma24 family protein
MVVTPKLSHGGPGPDLVPTRRSLLSRLKRWEDQESWREFFDTYWKLIYSVAVLSIAKKMAGYRYDPEVCSFKGWLLRVTRFRILDQLRKRQHGIHPASPSSGTGGTPTLERIPDPGSLALESLWDAEWEKNLLDVAMEQVKRRVNAAHYQIFYWNAIQGVKPAQVARMAGVNVAQVYIVKQRIGRLVRQTVESLKAQTETHRSEL